MLSRHFEHFRLLQVRLCRWLVTCLTFVLHFRLVNVVSLRQQLLLMTLGLLVVDCF